MRSFGLVEKSVLRGRRRMLPFAVAIVAALLALLVVPAITLTPPTALAASGSVEVLVDADGDSGTDPVREFAGATRYETSLAAGRQYVETARAAGTPATTAIIASGEGLIDAASAAGLARAANAPVLLTPPDQLFVPVAHLIESAGITRVLIVGGAAAVSQQVAATLATVPGVASVERIGGRNRYDTAALIAVAMNVDAQYCNSGLKSALLVTGDTELLTDVTVAGPMSYAAGIPILLTATGSVPAETIAALQALGIQHVVAVGGAFFPADVQTAAGVERITVINGGNRFATAVEMLRQMETCMGAAFSSNTVALISETALPDGISAAPMLGQGLLQNGQTTPALLVSSNAIPPETKDYLFATPRAIEITTIGGANAVSPAVARIAVAAANGENLSLPRPSSFTPGDPQACRLPGSTGFPLRTNFPAPRGVFDVAVLFLDFPDAPAPYSTFTEGDEQLREVERYFETVSYGQMDVQFHQHNTWLRAPSSWRDYIFETVIDSQSLDPYMTAKEAIALASPSFDFSFDYEVIMVVAPSAHFGGGIASGSGLSELIPGDPEAVRQTSIINSHFFEPGNVFGSSSGNTEPHEWWKTAAHELGHNLSLNDLYPYDAAIRNPTGRPPPGKTWVRTDFGLMGLQGFLLVDNDDTDYQVNTRFSGDFGNQIDSHKDALEMLGWLRWQLDWLRENEVACLTQDVFDATVNLDPIANPDGTAIVVIPVSDTSGIVIESRRRIGYDDDNNFPLVREVNLVEEGLLIYRVDASVRGGRLPISLLTENSARRGQLSAYPVLTLGDTISEVLPDGTSIEITLESDDGFSHTARIKRS